MHVIDHVVLDHLLAVAKEHTGCCDAVVMIKAISLRCLVGKKLLLVGTVSQRYAYQETAVKPHWLLQMHRVVDMHDCINTLAALDMADTCAAHTKMSLQLPAQLLCMTLYVADV